MSVALISIVLNVALALALVFVMLKARARIIEEKLATFAGALNAFFYGLAAGDVETRWKRLAFGLQGMVGKDVEVRELEWRLIQASTIRYLRHEAVAADLGEHLHSLVLQSVRGDDEAIRVWDYIDGALGKEPGFEQEPSERFTAAELAKAQFQIEGDLYRMYERTLTGHPPKVFG
ncbi:hypothetical protein ACO2Q1_10600 [Brevundimonas sp. VNH65]|uniref:hypothetical protein n=1 Tax=Brevundimonas sp. VNH65 TaxID=3400917 RepID=UPI003C09F0A1